MSAISKLANQSNAGSEATQLPAAVAIPINGIALPGELFVPVDARGIVLYTVASGCIRETPCNSMVARHLYVASLGTLIFSLLTSPEAQKDVRSGDWSFDLDLLTHRLLLATKWVMQQPRTGHLRIGYLATSTGAAAALVAAAQLGYVVEAVVSRGGRPDFAGDYFARVTAPTLLIVGERDEGLLDLNRHAYNRLTCRKEMTVIPGASHLFDEPGALDQVGKLAAAWFRTHLKPRPRT
jgi:putative phosphoribosyl transferase